MIDKFLSKLGNNIQHIKKYVKDEEHKLMYDKLIKTLNISLIDIYCTGKYKQVLYNIDYYYCKLINDLKINDIEQSLFSIFKNKKTKKNDDENINIHIFNGKYHSLKKRKYDIKKNINLWIDLIQAKVKFDYPLYVLEYIKKNSNLPLNAYEIRELLCKKKLGIYYKYIPYFIKILSNECINFTYDEEDKIKNIIMRIINIYKKELRCKNCIYLPYIILKIMENNDCFKNRINLYKRIIYIQKNKTIIKHDEIYKKICNNTIDFKFNETLINR